MLSPTLALQPRHHHGAPMPGLLWGAYPQRPDKHDSRPPERQQRARQAMPARLGSVRQQLAWLAAQDDAALSAHRQQQQAHWALDASAPAHVEQAVALAADSARRSLGMAAFDTQLAAALYLLDEQLVEMATGEGKSLATALAAAAAAMMGMPVHVITANDYLVQRDAQEFAPLYARLDLSVAPVLSAHASELRRSSYAHHVVYVTAKELVFDYLRDRSLRPVAQAPLQQQWRHTNGAAPPLLRGLCMAIIDEADSVLIDEALMPLILSRETHAAGERAYRWQAWALSGKLAEGEHFTRQGASRQVMLTAAGHAQLQTLAQPLGLHWRSTRHRTHAICTALAARHLYQRDRDYIVQPAVDARGRRADRIVIVDAVSGRLAEGRRWSQGLHAMMAIKEGCKPEPELETIAQITYQRFFRRYHRLGGLSGTLTEARAELRTLYGLPIANVAPRLPLRRHIQDTQVFANNAQRWQAVAQRCALLHTQGRPVLIGTDSVADSQALAAALSAAGLPHSVLNAHYDAQEAAIIASAGQAGRITVATNMAGRGTDIHVAAAECAAGGLHVLCCQLNPSRRIDRQLIGRTARQGQPGSAQIWLALDHPRWQSSAASRLVARCMALCLPPSPATPSRPRWQHLWLQCCLHTLQWLQERQQARARIGFFQQDCMAERSLPFSPTS